MFIFIHWNFGWSSHPWMKRGFNIEGGQKIYMQHTLLDDNFLIKLLFLEQPNFCQNMFNYEHVDLFLNLMKNNISQSQIFRVYYTLLFYLYFFFAMGRCLFGRVPKLWVRFWFFKTLTIPQTNFIFGHLLY